MAKHKYIESPEELWGWFCKYREDKKSDPIQVVDYVGKDAIKVLKPHQRPLTMAGFSAWLFENDVIKDVWHYFTNADNKYDEYLDICRAIKEIIRTDQIEGGMVGIYNPSITQRLNSLTEKSEMTVREQPLFGDE